MCKKRIEEIEARKTEMAEYWYERAHKYGEEKALEKIGDVKSSLAGLSTEKSALQAKQQEQMDRQDQIKREKRDLENDKENLQLNFQSVEFFFILL